LSPPNISEKFVHKTVERKKNEKALEKYFQQLPSLHSNPAFLNFIQKRELRDSIMDLRKAGVKAGPVSIEEFEFLKMLGEGCMGQVSPPFLLFSFCSCTFLDTLLCSLSFRYFWSS